MMAVGTEVLLLGSLDGGAGGKSWGLPTDSCRLCILPSRSNGSPIPKALSAVQHRDLFHEAQAWTNGHSSN